MERGGGEQGGWYQKTEKHSGDASSVLSCCLCHGISFPKKDLIQAAALDWVRIWDSSPVMHEILMTQIGLTAVKHVMISQLSHNDIVRHGTW